MKIQFSPKRIIDDALVVWPEKTPETELINDGLAFANGLIQTIYSFGFLGNLQPEQVLSALTHWFNILAPGGELYIIESDFDYLCRALTAADLKLEEFNRDYRQTCYFSRESLVALMLKSGFLENDLRIWFDGLKFKREHHQLVISGKKPNIKQL